jgi:hypothetical protein
MTLRAEISAAAGWPTLRQDGSCFGSCSGWYRRTSNGVLCSFARKCRGQEKEEGPAGQEGSQTERRNSFGYRLGMDYHRVAHDETLTTLARHWGSMASEFPGGIRTPVKTD